MYGRRQAAWLVLLVSLLAGTAHADTRHVLLLTSSERPFAPQSAFFDALRPELTKLSPDPIHFTEIAVQSARATSTTPDASIANRLRDAFAKGHFDLVITVGGPAATFGQQFRGELFPRTPLLVAGVDRRFLQEGRLTDLDAVVATEHNAAPIVDEMLRLLPGTRTVMVVIGASPLEQFWVRQLQSDFRRFDQRLRFVWTNGMSFAEMLESARSLPQQSAILFTLLSMDARGEPLQGEEAFASLHAAANAPMFGLFGAQLGRGIVGGRLIVQEELSRTTIDAALRILGGEPARTVRAAVQQVGTPTYDWRELQRWNIPEDRLPGGSMVRFREPTMWQRSKGAVVAGMTLAGVPAVLAIAFLVARSRQRRPTPRQQSIHPALPAVPPDATVRIWTTDEGGRRLEPSRPVDDVSADEWTRYVHPDDLNRCIGVYGQAVRRREPFQMEYRVRRENSAERCVLDTGVPTFTGATFRGYVGSVVDVTTLTVARAELSNLSRHLMHTHEEAQAAVSAKLRQDLCQRMIGLTLRLHRLTAETESRVVQSGIEEVSDQLAGVASELFAVGDPMYDRLKLLGLASECRILCAEASKAHDTVIAFHEEGVPPRLPSDLSLALFRVLQEAIVNAVNHSRARDIQVSLRGTGSELCLDIASSAPGFGARRDVPWSPVGLTAIRERLESLNGGCTLERRSDGATRVRAWLPLTAQQS